MAEPPPTSDDGSAYADFRDGLALLDAGNAHAATLPLERARDAEPASSSIHEALGRAYFDSVRFAQAAEEFAAVVELDPVNDYAHFGLGLSLSRLGEADGARRHLRIAVAMRPENVDYRRALDALERS